MTRIRKLTQDQILSIVELKQTMTWPQVAKHLGISEAMAKVYGKKLTEAGYVIARVPSIAPLDLSGKQ